MSVIAIVLTTLVGCFLFLTMVAQHQKWGRAISRFDPFRIVPRWTFFAPNPAIHDTNLVVRNLSRETSSPWQAVRICGSRRALHVLWNPDKRVQKMVTDLTQSLIMLTQKPEIGEDGCPTTLPYLLLFHYCAMFAKATEGEVLEFAVIRTSGRTNRRIWLIFKSGSHRL